MLDYSAATTVVVEATQTVTGIDAALTPLEKSIEGKVTSADAPGGIKGLKVRVYKWIGDGVPLGEGGDPSLACYWDDAQQAYTSADGTFAFWGLGAGYYRIGVFDYNGNYVDEFYQDKAHVEDAMDIQYDGSTLVSGINVVLEKRVGEA